MNRFEELKKVLKEHRYFKIVCGAGNEDCEETRMLSLVYTLAGATSIDVSANVDVVKSSLSGIARAFELSSSLDRQIKIRPFVNVSIGMKGDPHARKARISIKCCVSCGSCIKKCSQKAISDKYEIVVKRCIGCGECARVCQVGAISFFDKTRDLKKILSECLRSGAETFELHAVTADEQAVMQDWQMMNNILKDNYISMCLDRSRLSEKHLIERIKLAHGITGDRLIVQADGMPMSGTNDDYNTTLQAVATADLVQKSGITVIVLISGGTNSKTGKLVRLCGVEINGVSIGTFARKIVQKFITQKDFENNLDLINKAVSVAEQLISDNLREIRD